MAGKPASGTNLPFHRFQPSPPLPGVGHWGDISAGVRAESPEGLGSGKCPGRAEGPEESRNTTGQAISLEHDALAEVSAQMQAEKLLLPSPLANSSLPAAWSRGKSAPAKGPLAQGKL